MIRPILSLLVASTIAIPLSVAAGGDFGTRSYLASDPVQSSSGSGPAVDIGAPWPVIWGFGDAESPNAQRLVRDALIVFRAYCPNMRNATPDILRGWEVNYVVFVPDGTEMSKRGWQAYLTIEPIWTEPAAADWSEKLNGRLPAALMGLGAGNRPGVVQLGIDAGRLCGRPVEQRALPAIDAPELSLLSALPEALR